MGNGVTRTLGDALDAVSGDAGMWNAWVRYAVYEDPATFFPEYREKDTELSYFETGGGFNAQAVLLRGGKRRTYYFANVMDTQRAAVGDVVDLVTRAVGEDARIIVVSPDDKVPPEWEVCIGGDVRAFTRRDLEPLLRREITRPGLWRKKT